MLFFHEHNGFSVPYLGFDHLVYKHRYFVWGLSTEQSGQSPIEPCEPGQRDDFAQE